MLGRTRDGVFILVDEILGHVLLHEFIGLGWHPCVHEGGEVEQGRAVEGEFVVDQLVRRLCIGSLSVLLGM